MRLNSSCFFLAIVLTIRFTHEIVGNCGAIAVGPLPDSFEGTIPNAAVCSTRDARKVSPEKISSLAGTLSMGANPQCASLQTLSVSGDRWGSSQDTPRMSALALNAIPPVD